MAEWVNYICGSNFDTFLNGDLSQNSLSFLTLLYNSYDRFLPTKFKPTVSRNSSPWITNDIIILIRKKYKLFNFLRRGSIPRHHFCVYRNLLNCVKHDFQFFSLSRPWSFFSVFFFKVKNLCQQIHDQQT